jgi:hypothetical protein
MRRRRGLRSGMSAGVVASMQGLAPPLERDDVSSSRHPALPPRLSMILSENR